MEFLALMDDEKIPSRLKKRKSRFALWTFFARKTSDSGTNREFRAKRRHECLYADHEDRFTRFRGFLR